MMMTMTMKMTMTLILIMIMIMIMIMTMTMTITITMIRTCERRPTTTQSGCSRTLEARSLFVYVDVYDDGNLYDVFDNDGDSDCQKKSNPG